MTTRRVYLRKRSVVSWKNTLTTAPFDVVIYEPACLTGTGKARWRRCPWLAELEHRARAQQQERLERRLATASLRALTGHMGRGRPRVHSDQGILGYLGLRRHGQRVFETRAMSTEERARRRYGLLAQAWRNVLTEQEYVAFETDLMRQRKRASRLRLPWNPGQCRAELIQALLQQKGLS